MFNTMTMTKVVGGFCGALLIYLLANWVGESLYQVGEAHHGEGEEAHQAYSIEVASAEGGAAEEGPDFATLLAAADPAKGERVFNKCKACHHLDGADATGPHLNGVVGRPVGSVGGFGYSGALSENFDQWTPENLYAFLENPRKAAAGTTMSFAGLGKPEDRANLISYLATTQ